jgi:selenide,water dikinase
MADLAHVLRHLPPADNPLLLAGSDLGDDAAVYRLSDELALVQTVDFFTPIVDDPYQFGQIAAANSLSDVYAVGGTPLTALNIVGFPTKSLPMSILAEILRGGVDKAREAGVTIVGGHTVDDDEPKYGLAVTGTVHPERFLTGAGGRPGDVLVLTKPLGTGTIATALKAGDARPEHVAQATRWMSRLNREAAAAMLACRAHAVSDISGFGLLGHLAALCRSSKLAARVFARKLPLLPGALACVAEWRVPGGTASNLEALETDVRFGDVDDLTVQLLADPQTSGGLLVALPGEKVEQFSAMVGREALSAVVGELVSGVPGHIDVLP